jgi:hypothetical protein
METTDLKKLKRPQLIELAGHFRIKKRHRLRKRELVKLLEKLLPEIPEKLSLAFMPPRKAESSTRFAPQAPGPSQTAYVDRGAPLPLHYGQDCLTALVRDPNCLFIYWELEGPRRQEVLARYGRDVFTHSSWVLRLYSDGDGPPHDAPVVVEACNWYLPVAEDGGYRVEIGVRRKDGEFIHFAGSNRVRTPRTGVSPDKSTRWMLVEEDFRRVAHLAEGDAPKVRGAFADTLAGRFRVPSMGTRFLQPGERLGAAVVEHLGASGRVPGSPGAAKKRRASDK